MIDEMRREFFFAVKVYGGIGAVFFIALIALLFGDYVWRHWPL